MSIVTWGVLLTLFSSFISALPNVAYEKVLKTEGEDQWVNNIQVTRHHLLYSSSPTHPPLLLLSSYPSLSLAH